MKETSERKLLTTSAAGTSEDMPHNPIATSGGEDVHANGLIDQDHMAGAIWNSCTAKMHNCFDLQCHFFLDQ